MAYIFYISAALDLHAEDGLPCSQPASGPVLQVLGDTVTG